MAVTDLIQGPVYGLSTPEADLDERLMPNFHYDDIFGTLVNRFLVQAVAGLVQRGMDLALLLAAAVGAAQRGG